MCCFHAVIQNATNSFLDPGSKYANCICSEKHPLLPTESRDSFGVHVHINHLQLLAENFEVIRKQVSEEATERYWDTSDLSFANNNIWIKEEITNTNSSTFTVYYGISQQNMLAFIPIASSNNLDTAVLEARKVMNKVDPTANLQLHPFASFQRWRYSIEENMCLDVVKIAEDAFFVVGSAVLPLDKQHPEQLGVLPARSKLMEFLFWRRKEIYQQLEKDGIISGEFFDEVGQNLFRFNPFRLNSWEEVQLATHLKMSEASIGEHMQTAADMNVTFLEYLRRTWDSLQKPFSEHKYDWVCGGLTLK